MLIENRKNKAFLPILLIIILGCIVYANTLKGKFIYDDISLIKYNEHIKSWASLPKILTEDLGAGSGQLSIFNRPIQMMTYIMDYSFWGLNEAGYHITNILLHILVSLCIYALAGMLGVGRPVRLLTSLLFIAHPLHTEAVAYISGRADPLATLFIILCAIFYIKQSLRDNTAAFVSMLVCYVLALFSKEYSAITPLLFLLYSYIFKTKLRRKEFFSLLVITAVYLIIRIAVLKYTPMTASAGFLQRAPGFFIAVTQYLRLLFLPFDLHMGYGKKLFGFYDLRAILGIVITAFLLSYAFKKRNNDKLVSFSILWFFITILPESNLIYPINAFMAEHWLYLPSLGFFLILARGLTYLYQKTKLKYAAFSFIICLLFFYSFLTIKQNHYWREPIPFYERTLKYAPDNWELYYNLALNYEDNGNNREAIALYRKVLEIKPKDVNTYFHLANIYHSLGQDPEAIRLYNEAIALNPSNALLYYWFGHFYDEAGKTKQALELYNKAMEKSPSFALIYISLGKIYNKLGEKDKAIAMFDKAIVLLKPVLGLEPDYAIVHSNLAEAYFYTGQYDLAIKHCDKAIKCGYKVKPEFLGLLKAHRIKPLK
jgi:tetratricopeptide (TPR) repeat protein